MFMVFTIINIKASPVVVDDHKEVVSSTTTATTTRTKVHESESWPTPSRTPTSEYDVSDHDEVESHPLFPVISNGNFTEKTAGLNAASAPVQSHPQLCSTGLTTRLLPFKNSKGEIEWAFTEDVPGNELDVFKLNTKDHTYKVAKDIRPKKEPSSDEDLSEVESDDYQHQDKNNSRQGIELSPITSNSSNNESIDSPQLNKKLDTQNFTSPTSSELESADGDGDVDVDGEDGEDGDKIHHCPHCEATFKIRGYLTRHLKKHADTKAYTCPFHKFSIYIDEHNNTHKCHPNGGFSRRDTYKTHLKSRHFKYPKGIKTKDRPRSSGNCSMCGEFFENAEIWCEIHVEGGECKYLPPGFKGKSRIKNRLRRERIQREKAIQRKMRQQILRDQKNGVNPRSSQQGGIYPSQDQSNFTGLDSEYSTPFMDTPKSINTPVHNTEQSPGAYSVQSHHTVNSSGSPIYNQMHQQQPIPQQPKPQTFREDFGFPQLLNNNSNNDDYTYPKQQATQFQYATQLFTPPVLNSLYSSLSTSVSHEDYEDDYCLDVDQLTYVPIDQPKEEPQIPHREPSPNIWNYLKAQGSLNYQEVKVERYV